MINRITKENLDDFIKEFVESLKDNGFFKKNLKEEDYADFSTILKDELLLNLNKKNKKYINRDTVLYWINKPQFSEFIEQNKLMNKINQVDFFNKNNKFNNSLYDFFAYKKNKPFIFIGVLVFLVLLLALISIFTDSIVCFIFSLIFAIPTIFLLTYYFNIFKPKASDEKLPLAIKIPVLFIATAIFILFYYFIILPPLSFKSGSFVIFITISIILTSSVIVYAIYKLFIKNLKSTAKIYKWTISSILGVSILFSIVGELTSAELFRAKDYANLLTIETINDTQKLNEDFNYKDNDIVLPILDKAMALRQAEIALGDFGNQYYINQNHFNIQSFEYEGVQKIIRVVPLEYSNFFLSMQNNKIGTPGYIYVDLVTGENKLITDYPIVYCESAKLYSDLLRHIRLNNIYDLFDSYYFEIDDNYHPYWIVPCYEKKVGVFGGKVPSKVLTIEADTGTINSYNIDNAPLWIDHVVDLKIVENLASYNFKYKKGFINATIGTKEDVFIINEGYNYFIKEGEPFYVSSVTSSDERDQTAIGFITFSLRTMKAKFYSKIGITENRAMDIARLDDSVKAMNLTATWPIYISINNTPTFFLTLKNDVKVQKYVFINQETGEEPIIEDSLLMAYTEYLKSLGGKVESNTVSGTVSRKEIVGNFAYFTVENNNDIVYKAPLDMNSKLYVMMKGDYISFNYILQESEYLVVEIDSLVLA